MYFKVLLIVAVIAALVTDKGASAYECSCHLEVCTDVYFQSKMDKLSTQNYYLCVYDVYCEDGSTGAVHRDDMLSQIHDELTTFVTHKGASAYECSCHLQVCTDVYRQSKMDKLSTQKYYQCVNNVYCEDASTGEELKEYMLIQINDDIVKWDDKNSGTSYQPTFALTVSLLTLCGNVPMP